MKMFTTIMLDIHDIMEKDKLFFFLNGLSCDAIIKLQRRRVQNLADVMTVIEQLFNYDIRFPTSMKS